MTGHTAYWTLVQPGTCRPRYEAPGITAVRVVKASANDLLPRHWRVIILAVSPLTHFDQDEALNLLAAVQKLRADHKDLVVCGANRSQFKVMREAGMADVLGVENFCPDLDITVARAMNRVNEFLGAGLAREFAFGPM